MAGTRSLLPPQQAFSRPPSKTESGASAERVRGDWERAVGPFAQCFPK